MLSFVYNFISIASFFVELWLLEFYIWKIGRVADPGRVAGGVVRLHDPVDLVEGVGYSVQRGM